MLKGSTEEKYFQIQDISSDTLRKYNHIYEVASEVVNIRNSTALGEESKIGEVYEGQYLLGGNKIISSDNSFSWVPVVHFDGDGYVEAYICYEYVKGLDYNINGKILKEKEMDKKRVIDTSKSDHVDLNLRSERNIQQDNVITTIPDGCVVEIVGDEGVYDNGLEWTYISYIDSDGNEHKGWGVNDYMQPYDLVEYWVYIKGDKDGTLNIREEPGVDSEVIGSIENGTHLFIPSANMDNTRFADGYEWVRIALGDISGYVATDYIERFINDADELEADSNILSQDELDKIIKNARVNKNGRIVGIDVAFINPDDLRRILTDENAIPSTATYENTVTGETIDYNTEDLSGRINYVYIRLGATGYGEEGNPVQFDDNVLELIKVCEELGIPYGLYYFGQAKTIEEANREIDLIQKYLSLIESDKYNVLPFAYDYEKFTSTGRLAGYDGTEVVAYIINKLSNILGDDVILYADPNDIAPYLDDDESEENPNRIIDIERLNELLVNQPVAVWLVASRYSQSNKVSRQALINATAPYATIMMVQSIQDVSNPDEGLPKVDIDIISPESFEKLIYRTIYEEEGRSVTYFSEDEIEQ